MDTQLKNILMQVFDNEVVSINSDSILIECQIPKGLKVINLDASVLFVDIRKSSLLSEAINRKNMTKVYHMFSKIVAKAVHENYGRILQFAGDGFMAAFINKNHKTSGVHAFQAAIEIDELIQDTYKESIPEDYHFDCGFGIASGHIYMTRLKQKQYKLQSFGIFPGNATNFASKICNVAKEREIIFDDKSYRMNSSSNAVVDEIEGKVVWRWQI